MYRVFFVSVCCVVTQGVDVNARDSSQMYSLSSMETAIWAKIPGPNDMEIVRSLLSARGIVDNQDMERAIKSRCLDVVRLLWEWTDFDAEDFYRVTGWNVWHLLVERENFPGSHIMQMADFLKQKNTLHMIVAPSISGTTPLMYATLKPASKRAIKQHVNVHHRNSRFSGCPFVYCCLVFFCQLQVYEQRLSESTLQFVPVMVLVQLIIDYVFVEKVLSLHFVPQNNHRYDFSIYADF